MDTLLKVTVITISSIANLTIGGGIFVLLYGQYACFFVYMKITDKEKLDLPSMRARIGNLYADFETVNFMEQPQSIEYYSLFFFARRAVFVLISFALFAYPGLQIMAFLQLNIFYIIYVGHVTFYQEKILKTTEITNESIGLVMGYSYLMLMNIVSDSKLRNYLGLSIVVAAGVLIFLNVIQLGKTVYHKTKLRMLKYRQEKAVKKLKTKRQEI